MSGAPAALPATAVPSPEYAAAMTAVAHSDPIPAPSASTPPVDTSGVPAKFKNQDGSVNTVALMASYAELERKQSATPPAVVGPAAVVAPAVADPAAVVAPAVADPAKPGTKVERPVDPAAATPSPLSDAVSAVRTAYEAGGEVSEDLIKPLTDAGLPPEMIQTYFAGLKAIEASITLAAHTAAGGEAQFEAARTWAATALTDGDLDYYNTQAANPATAKQAVEWLMSKHGVANPSEGRTVEAEALSSAAGDVYASQQDVTAAMSSREYKTSPAYRQQVAEKLQRSIKSGSIRSTAEFHSR